MVCRMRPGEKRERARGWSRNIVGSDDGSESYVTEVQHPFVLRVH